MILLTVAMAAAAPDDAVAAERRFAADARAIGYQGALAKWAAPGAVTLKPETATAQAQADIESNEPFRWQPTSSFVSCDGRLAVNTGGWQRVSGAGWFTTVWRLDADGRWRWIVTAGGPLAHRRPDQAVPIVTRAACPAKGERATPWHMFHTPPPGIVTGEGAAPDGTLRWGWQRWPAGGWRLSAVLRGFGEVIADGM